MDEEFKEMRTVTKQKLATSKQMLESADDEVREKFQQIDQVRFPRLSSSSRIAS